MKAYVSLILTTIISINYSFAQLEVNDTLLMAFDNDVFWSSSSELEQDIYADFGKYGSTNLADNDSTTCWAEGSENDGSGEFVWFVIPESTETIKIRNGYQKNESIFFANNRPKNIEFELYACYEPSAFVTESHNGFFFSEKLFTAKATLKDEFGYQDVLLDFNWPDIHESLSHDKTFPKDRFLLKLKIVDVYKGSKWNDACISDIIIVPNPYYDLTTDEHGLLKVKTHNTDTLFYYPENIYQVMEISANLEWIIFIEMPSNIENSRVETIYKLFNTKKERFLKIEEITSMYGFTKKSGKYYLEGLNNNLNDTTILL